MSPSDRRGSPHGATVATWCAATLWCAIQGPALAAEPNFPHQHPIWL